MAQHNNKKKVAVFFGCRSPEHDVSVVTGLQVLGALDPSRYDGFPVYITPDGRWLVGDVLRDRSNYMLTEEHLKQTTRVTLDITAGGKGRLIPLKAPLLGQTKPIEFDIAMPAFHGLYGEDGTVAGAFETAGVPYAGMRMMASAIAMDKGITKKILAALNIPYLDYRIIRRPDQGHFVSVADLESQVGTFKFPAVVKPVHLGSSIGVAKVKDFEELSACLPPIFEMDGQAILEPYVENLVEYNAAVANMNGEPTLSAIERPKTHDELLDFKQKYMSGGGSKAGAKTGGTKDAWTISEGMLSLTRELNPSISPELEGNIHKWGKSLFEAIGGTGAPRIDFIGNSKTGELWVNEINPFPGSIGYFLWEALEEPVLFSELLTHLLEEGLTEHKKSRLPKDLVPAGAGLLKR